MPIGRQFVYAKIILKFSPETSYILYIMTVHVCSIRQYSVFDSLSAARLYSKTGLQKLSTSCWSAGSVRRCDLPYILLKALKHCLLLGLLLVRHVRPAVIEVIESLF